MLKAIIFLSYILDFYPFPPRILPNLKCFVEDIALALALGRWQGINFLKWGKGFRKGDNVRGERSTAVKSTDSSVASS